MNNAACYQKSEAAYSGGARGVLCFQEMFFIRKTFGNGESAPMPNASWLLSGRERPLTFVFVASTLLTISRTRTQASQRIRDLLRRLVVFDVAAQNLVRHRIRQGIGVLLIGRSSPMALGEHVFRNRIIMPLVGDTRKPNTPVFWYVVMTARLRTCRRTACNNRPRAHLIAVVSTSGPIYSRAPQRDTAQSDCRFSSVTPRFAVEQSRSSCRNASYWFRIGMISKRMPVLAMSRASVTLCSEE